VNDVIVVDDLEELIGLIDGRRRLFLRYSAGAEDDLRNGPSCDYEAGICMPGWSVTTIAPEPWWTRPAEDWIARRVCKYLDHGDMMADWRPWLLTGRVVGWGPDHEPLVVDMTLIAWLSEDLVQQARTLYDERFDVGKESA
jgi:hypothetical protein